MATGFSPSQKEILETGNSARKFQQQENFMSTTVLELTAQNIEEIISKNKMVVIDFWAPWCGPCKRFAPVFEAAATKHLDVVFAKVNTDEQQEIAGSFEIRSIPTLAIFKEQTLIYHEAGALPEEGLEEILKQVRALDMNQVREEIKKRESEMPGNTIVKP
jgi:thioredoxin